MEWDDVHVLLALLREKNLRGAGARLGVDASTISRRLSALEQTIDARLFVRTREGLKPTARAVRLLPLAERMESDAASFVHMLRAGDARATGVVRVATTEALARMLVSEGLLELRVEHPNLVIELISGNHEVNLARGDADIALRLSPLKQPALRARCIATMGIGLFAAPSYLRARGSARTIAALRGHDVLLPTGELSRLPEARWLAARHGVRVVLRSNSMPALVEAAIRAHGLVPLPLGWGDSEPALERALVLEAIPHRKVWLVTHESADGRPAIQVVAREMAAVLARMFA